MKLVHCKSSVQQVHTLLKCVWCTCTFKDVHAGLSAPYVHRFGENVIVLLIKIAKA
jgi:hypothetical protein